jgi:LPXTG-site transpeptidase (sortase) family protein
MSEAGSTTSARSRWGRYALSAAILALTVIGVTAVLRGAHDQPAAEPPLAAAATAPEAASSASSKALTAGPLMSTSSPTRVVIPALNVDVPVTGLGQQADGAMQVPTDAKTVGWYTRAPTPGSLGPAILAGHVDYKKQPGTFNRLSDLKKGDHITVDRQDGSMAMFAVVQVQRYEKDKFPTEAVYGPINRAGLRLITCGGDFDSTKGHYKDNIVVYADLTMAHPAP